MNVDSVIAQALVQAGILGPVPLPDAPVGSVVCPPLGVAISDVVEGRTEPQMPKTRSRYPSDDVDIRAVVSDTGRRIAYMEGVEPFRYRRTQGQCQCDSVNVPIAVMGCLSVAKASDSISTRPDRACPQPARGWPIPPTNSPPDIFWAVGPASITARTGTVASAPSGDLRGLGAECCPAPQTGTLYTHREALLPGATPRTVPAVSGLLHANHIKWG